MWKGTISFGLVTVPVKMYSAQEDAKDKAHLAHGADGGAIRFRRVCEACDAEVAFGDMHKAFDYAGERVVVDPAELDALKVASDKAIKVEHFTVPAQIDPVSRSRSYYLAPDKGGETAYALVAAALEETGKVAVAKVSLRQRESLVILSAEGPQIILTTLLYPSEVRERVVTAQAPVDSKMLDAAVDLLNSMTDDFDPSLHADGYAAAVEALVASKATGVPLSTDDAEALPAPSVGDNLMAALLASKAAA